jgi:endonuclease/exonuclease/phosphatase family metal-dependent hydrolase
VKRAWTCGLVRLASGLMIRSLTILLAVALAALAAAAPATARDRDLDVVSYNIHHAAGVDERLDLERIARVIDTTGADVAALQEVDRHWGARSEFVDQASWLARRLRMHVVYGANLDVEPEQPGQPRRQYGTAILSDFPIHSWRNTLLPRPEGGEQRGLLEAVVNVRGARVRIANTHLQHNSAVERTAQALRIAELLDGAREPIVLTGDLNARPADPELAPLFARFADAWTLGGTGDGFTLPAEAPTARIDYVLTSPTIGVESARVMPTLASDHLPVVAELEVPRKTRSE